MNRKDNTSTHLIKVCFLSTSEGPCTSPALPSNAGGVPGIFSFSPANMLAASSVKQKSAFAPVARPAVPGAPEFGSSASPHANFTMSGIQAGWAHPFYSVSIAWHCITSHLLLYS